MIQAELTGDRLTKKQIIDLIATHPRTKYSENDKYAKGENVKILSRVFKDVKAPHNNTPVSYARKIVNTVSGYMFKPGLIVYASDNDKYLDTLTDVFHANDEDIKSALLGRQATIQGVAYELHYTLGTEIRFAKVSAEEMIPVYDYALESNLIAAIRHYPKGDVWKVEVYYADVIDYYDMIEAATVSKYVKETDLVQTATLPHFYGSVPLVVYPNNEEQIGDFEPVKPLIDAYDVLISDSLNEFDRFAYAYLVLKGLSMDKATADDVRQKRIFNNVPIDGSVDFLTKDIPAGFIDFMTNLVRKEIHKQSHVPDFTEVVTGTFTGAALDRILYDFELVAAVKEALFTKALYRRVELIDVVLQAQGKLTGDVDDLEIIMNRNKPTSLIELGDAMQRYAGIVSDKTLLENFAPFVENAQDEVDAREEQSKARMPTLMDPVDDEEADDEES